MRKQPKSSDEATVKRLLAKAKTAQKRSHSPYSEFPVGAALLTSSGRIILGTNVENASYGATICAERSAITAAISAGLSTFQAMAIVANGTKPPIPCGMCLQVLAEFCSPDFELILAPTPALTPVKRFLLKELLPKTFVFKK